MAEKKFRINTECLYRLKLCLIRVFRSPNSWFLFILLLALCLGQQLVYYQVGLLSSKFMEVLGYIRISTYKFKVLLFETFLLILTVSLFNCATNLVSSYLYLNWRDFLTKDVHKSYLNQETFYRINFEGFVDNIDQRITQDVDKFCLQLSSISAKLVISPFTIIYYSVKCYEVSGYTGLLAIYGYFIIGSLLNKFIMSSIVNLIFQQEKLEGDFRYKHTELRSFFESIALMKSVDKERKNVNVYFHKLISTQTSIANVRILLDFSTNIFDYLGAVLSYIIISFAILTGKYDSLKPFELSSLIAKNAFISMYLINCFSTLIDLSSNAAEIFGYAHRIGQLIEQLNTYKCTSISDLSLQPLDNADILYELQGVTFSAPNSSKTLVSNLSIVINKNENILIMGNTGVGKSSLLRVISGLWELTDGRIVSYLCESDVLFLPQKPFLTNGSILDLVIYPHSNIKMSSTSKVIDRVYDALKKVGLLEIVDRLGNIHVESSNRWCDIISPGEVQRLNFARLFYHKPKLAVVDEISGALSIHEEENLYRYCQQLGITLLSVGHNASLKQFHHKCLTLKGNGEWELSQIEFC
ncbi:lysosomal cobalamin transporter ABCD4 [Hydra vulgaris]|uniref:ATP-binding cassette sub-family D member 4 n=1 Tax=Hydra vulgaris TaxID=6087 RepID=T2MIR1_HYDVU|nr:lysosomal cobalamin transporter ABCD4 [Hydra vulgaris]